MDPHKVLGVPKGASAEQIREAYRKKSKKYHPDVGGDDWVFIQIEEAYRYLIALADDNEQWSEYPGRGATTEQREERSGAASQDYRSATTHGESPKGQSRVGEKSPQGPANTLASIAGASLLSCLLGLVLAYFLNLSYTICGILGIIGGGVGGGVTSSTSINRHTKGQR